MSLATDRIQFLLTPAFSWNRGLLQSQISASTGIPQSTLSYVSRGMRPLPAQYETSLRKLYTSTAYDRLREQGASWLIGNKHKWGSPDQVYDDIRLIYFKREELVRGVVGAKISRLDKLGQTYDTEELVAEADEQMIRSLQKSRKTLEQWMDY